MSSNQTVAVVGAGAMGSLIGAMLAATGRDVTLFGRDVHSFENWPGQTLTLVRETGEIRAKIRTAWDSSAFEPFDLALLLVKTPDTRSAIETHRTLFTQAKTVLTLQNGAGNLEALAEVVPTERLLGGSTTHGAYRLGPGKVRHAGVGDTVVGPLMEQNAEARQRAEAVAEIFTQAGLQTTVHERIQAVIWTKLAVNAGINPFCGLLEVPNGVLAEHEETLELSRAAAAEVVDVANRLGYGLNRDEILAKVREVIRKTANNRSSMLADVLAGKPTEIDAICGAVVAAGEKAGTPTPVNRVLWKLVKAKDLVGMKNRER